jgi:hypothetical protein
MKTLDTFQHELFEFLEELVAAEKEELKELRRDGHMNSVASGVSMGGLDTIKQILDWIADWNQSPDAEAT